MEKRTSVHLGKVPLYGDKMALLFYCQENKAFRALTAHLQHRTDNAEIPFVELNRWFS